MKVHYSGLLNHYCPLSSSLLSLADDASAASAPTTIDQPQDAMTMPSNDVRPAAHQTASESATAVVRAAANTELSSKQQQSLKLDYKEDGDEVVSHESESFEGPLPTMSAGAAANAGDTGGVSHCDAGAGVIGDCQQPTLAAHKPPQTPPPLKETIAQLVSQGKLTYTQASEYEIMFLDIETV